MIKPDRLKKQKEYKKERLSPHNPVIALFIYHFPLSGVSARKGSTQIPSDFITALIFSSALASAPAKQLRQPISPFTSI